MDDQLKTIVLGFVNIAKSVYLLHIHNFTRTLFWHSLLTISAFSDYLL